MKHVGLTGIYHRWCGPPDTDATSETPPRLTITCDLYAAPGSPSAAAPAKASFAPEHPSVLRVRLKTRQESLEVELATHWSCVMDNFAPSTTLTGAVLLQAQSSDMRYHLTQWLRTRYVMREVHRHITTLLGASDLQNAAHVLAALAAAPKYLGPVYQSADPWFCTEADLAVAIEQVRDYAELESRPVKPPLKRR